MNNIPPYWTKSKVDKFEVSIKSVKKQDEQYHIRINENVIRPAGGGQAGDRGHLSVGNQVAVILDTIGDPDGVILVADKTLPEGTAGHLEIDMIWRSSMMKNHTAEHLFASIIRTQNEAITIGELWIDGKHGSVEFVGDALDLDTIFEAERQVLMIIDQDLPVNTSFVNSDTIDSSVRSREGLTEKHSKLRIVSIGEKDSSACSGIHVNRTGEIGFFKVLDVKASDRTTRVEFVTGIDAAITVSTVYNMALQRKYTYPFEMEQLGSVLDRAKLAVDDKHKLIDKITQLLSNGSSIERISDVTFRHEYLPGFDATSLKNLANQLQATGPTVFLLFAPGKKSQVILRVNEMPKEASEYVSKPMSSLGGKGGGKGEVFTGGFVDTENPVELYEDLVLEVGKSIT
jgi:alanyl-tRNA synthetase